jgi:hypothetical protein
MTYLQTTYSNPKLDSVWTPEDNENFLIFIKKNLPKNYLSQDENKQTVEQTFKDYFENVGHLIFQLKDNKINFKVLPYKIHAEDSAHLDEIVDILQKNKSLIELNYHNNQNQILIAEELKKKFDEFINHHDEQINKKELIKHVVKIGLELKDNDIIIIKDDKIFIKLVSQMKKTSVSEKDKNTIAGRYNGIEENELISFYDEYFSKEQREDFFQLVANTFGNRYFIDGMIDNTEYEKYAFKYMQDIIIELLGQNFDSDEEFFKGFSGYVFRIHFHESFEYLADFILHELIASNDKVIEFLEYYALQVVVINGEKFRVPELRSDDDLTWNITSITTVAKTYIKAKDIIDGFEDAIDKLDEAQFSLMVDDMTPVEYNQDLYQERDELVEDIEEASDDYRVLSDEYHTLKTERERTASKTQLADLKLEIKSLEEAKDEVLSDILDNSVLLKFKKLEDDINNLEKQIKSKTKAIQINEKTYNIVKDILSKALVAKKKKV